MARMAPTDRSPRASRRPYGRRAFLTRLLLALLAPACLSQAAADAAPDLALRPVSVPVAPSRQDVIDAFQYDTPFVKQSLAGTAEPDLTDVLVGTRSLRVITDGDGGQVNLRARNLGPLDLSRSFLTLHLKLTGLANLDYLYVYLSNDGFETFDTFAVLRGSDPPSTAYAKDDDWFTITTSLGTTVGGTAPTVDLTAVTDIQISLRDEGTGAVTAWFDSLGAVPRPARGKVSIIFDDARDGAFHYGLPLMQRFGLKASIAAIVDLVGRPTFMTLEQLKTAERFGGWEVIAHQTSDLYDGGYDTLAEGALEAELTGIKAWLLRHGFRRGADVIAYPNGGFDQVVLDHVKDYFAAGRTIVSIQGLETWPPADPFRLRAFSVTDADKPAAVASLIDRAARERSWLLLVFHQLSPQPSGKSTDYSTDDFASILAHLLAADVDVVLLSDAVFGR